jgi:DNA-binding transcriptional LysR family regulator
VRGRYVLADWGQDFLRFHETALPELPIPDVQMAVGTLILRYIAARPLAAYVPARSVRSYVDAGQLFPVEDAPSFAQEIWVVWRNDVESSLREVAQTTLGAAIAQVQAEVADLLGDG